MNLSISEAGTLLMNMIQQDYPEAIMNGGNSDIPKQAFADKLEKILQAADRKQNSFPGKSEYGKQAVSGHTAIEQLSEKIKDEKGHGFIAALKSILIMLTRGAMDDVEIDPAGLETLKKILEKAGFKQSDIEELITTLSQMGDEKTIKLDEVFDMIAGLSVDNESMEDEGHVVPGNTANFIESILTTLGLSPDQIQEIFTASDKGEAGYDLDVIIEGLNRIQKQAFYAQEEYQVPKTNNNLLTTGRALGINFENLEKNQVSLNDFVKILEQIRLPEQSAAPDQPGLKSVEAGDEKPAGLLSELFRYLKTKKEFSDKPAENISGREKFSGLFENSGFDKVQKGADSVLGIAEGKDAKNKIGKGFSKEADQSAIQKLSDALLQKEMAADSKSGVDKTALSREKRLETSQIAISETKTDTTGFRSSLPKTAGAPKPLPAYVAQQVGKGLVRAINQGDSSITLQLKPPELGKLLLTIDNTNNMMRVNIMTENHAAKEILSQNITELKSVLSSSGVNLERFEVDMSNDFRQSMADARQQAGFSGKNRGRQKGTNPDGRADSRTGEIGTVADQLPLNGPGSVHLVA